MKRSFAHISFKYIINKFFLLFYEFKNTDAPWLTSDAINILSSLIKNTDNAVEFGSGRSTVWFAKRVNSLISIESDKDWYRRIFDNLMILGLSNIVDYRLCDTEENYVHQISLISNESIDFCLIDGIARDLCALQMIKKIKRGGVLVIDNINWYLPNDSTTSPNSRRSKSGPASENWNKISNELGGWRVIWTSNGITDTAIWFKP